MACGKLDDMHEHRSDRARDGADTATAAGLNSPGSPTHDTAHDDVPQRTGQDGTGRTGTLYREALSPSLGVWLVSALLAALCILVFAPVNIGTGIAAAVLFLGIEIVLLQATTPRIVVTDAEVRVGRARIEREHIGEVTGYRGEHAREQQRARLHGRAYVCMRGWIGPVVRLQITDPRDETPYWLTSTRHPERLVEALGGSMHAGSCSAQSSPAQPRRTD